MEWKEIKCKQSGGVRIFLVVIDFARTCLQDRNREKSHPELFRGLLSDGQVKGIASPQLKLGFKKKSNLNTV